MALMPRPDLTHAELCTIAVRWLRRPHSGGGHGCTVAISEAWTDYSGERPDAIGFKTGWNAGSVVVECKTSRADFLADRSKPHRTAAGLGMGTWRYYMAPVGLLAAAEMPPKWGLIEVSPRGACRVVHGALVERRNHTALTDNMAAFAHLQVARERERDLLVRLLARLGDVEALNLRLREAEAARTRLILALERERVDRIAERSRRLAAELEATRQPDTPPAAPPE